MSSEASTSPPGQWTLRRTDFTRSSFAASFNCSSTCCTMLAPAPSSPELLMMPSIGTTAILLAEPCRSSTTSSRRVSFPSPGPAALNNRFRKKRDTLVNRVAARQRASTSVAIFQPRPAFDVLAGRFGPGRGGGGDAGSGGGGGGAGGGTSLSITARRLLEEQG